MAEEAAEARPLETDDLLADRPTGASFEKLQRWIIWQFPRQKGDGLCAAVHPPTAEYGWLPAVVALDKTAVWIHAHAAGPFPTPEAAADWMEEH